LKAKTKKIANGGAVAFDVKRVVLNGGKSNQQIVYCIDPKSIRNIYLGFTKVTFVVDVDVCLFVCLLL